MRKNEQFTVTLDQVSLREKHIFLIKTKNGSSRYVHLNSAALIVLRRFWRTISGWVMHLTHCCSSARTGNRSPIAQVVRDGSGPGGNKGATWHTLRHTFASRLVMADVRWSGCRCLWAQDAHPDAPLRAPCAWQTAEALERLVSPEAPPAAMVPFWRHYSGWRGMVPCWMRCMHLH